MRKLRKFDEFKEKGAVKALMETSKSKTDNNAVYMTDCCKMVVDFDQAKTNYCAGLGLDNEYAKSADALCETDLDIYYLIEFKNGSFESKEIAEKAKDSVYVLSGITEKNIRYIRDKVVFVLVFNKENRRIGPRDILAIKRANKAKEDFTLFGLSKLRGFYYGKVYALDKNEFNKSEILKNIVSL